MCKELIAMALCAPSKSPCLSFTCGKLHLIAADRKLCSSARGKCICFFGTCGTIETVATSAAVDLGDLIKQRCAGCTRREDIVGDRRKGKDLVESSLLTEWVITSAAEFRAFAKALKVIWGGAVVCPFHGGDSVTSMMQIGITIPENKNITFPEPIRHAKALSDSASDARASNESATNLQTNDVQNFDPPSPVQSLPEENTNGITTYIQEVNSYNEVEQEVEVKPQPGLETSAWATKQTAPPIQVMPAVYAAPQLMAKPVDRSVLRRNLESAGAQKGLAHMQAAKMLLKRK